MKQEASLLWSEYTIVLFAQKIRCKVLLWYSVSNAGTGQTGITYLEGSQVLSGPEYIRC